MGFWSRTKKGRILHDPDINNLSRGFNYDSNEIAIAFRRVAESRYGSAALSGINVDFQTIRVFDCPISFTTVKTGVSTEEQGLTGGVKIALPGKGEIYCNVSADRSMIGALFSTKYRGEVETFFEEIAEMLESHSIYKGQAVTTYRSFVDLSEVSFDGVVYDKKVRQELSEHVWAIIKKPEECAKAGVHLPRKVLFQGQYGTGKTLASYLTAKVAIENGWTFVYMPMSSLANPVALSGAIFFARRYSPVVLNVEDIDYEQKDGNEFTLRNTLDAIDGLLAKNTKILIVMTTNYPEDISPAMQRPGRIDKVIKFGTLGAEDTKTLITLSAGEYRFDQGINWSNVVEACKDYPPAFIQAVSKNAALKFINSGLAGFISEKALVDAALDLREQFAACRKGLSDGYL